MTHFNIIQTQEEKICNYYSMGQRERQKQIEIDRETDTTDRERQTERPTEQSVTARDRKTEQTDRQTESDEKHMDNWRVGGFHRQMKHFNQLDCL